MIHTKDERYSRIDLLRDTDSYIKFLEGQGVSAGDRVLLTSENSYSFIVSFFALIRLDCSVVLVDCMMGEKEIKRIIESSGAKICISDRSLPSLQTPVILLSIKRENNVHSLNRNWTFELWSERKDALILFTSGSSGSSKGIIKSGFSFLENLKRTMDVMGYDRKDVLLPLIPFTHFYGLSILFIWWYAECELVLDNYRKVRSTIKAIEEHKVTVVDGVPSTYYVLNQLMKKRVEIQNGIRDSKVRMWCIGGSPLSSKLAEDFFTLTGQHLLDGYGLSEVGNISLNTSDYHKGCGLPLKEIDLKIVNENSKEVLNGETGEIWVKTPGLMEGYLNQSEETEKAILDGWFRTNDLGYLDAAGHLFVIGRKGEAFLRKGYIIYPASIEKSIADSLGLKAKVITFVDARKDSYVLLMIEAPPEDEKRLKKIIMNEIEAMYQPDKIVFLEYFPYLPNGKIDSHLLNCLALNWKNQRKEGKS